MIRKLSLQFQKIVKLKFFLIVVIGMMLNVNAFAKIGKGELKLDSFAVDYFMKYIRGKGSNSPELFIISEESSWATYYYCPDGQGNCRDLSDQEGVKICERESNVNCATFARGRTIKWKNGINKGRGKTSRINSKWSDTEIRAKLTELGFLGGSSSSSTNLTPKNTEKKKETNVDEDIVKQLSDLKELLDSGALTQDEFDKAKKKILN